MCGSLFYFAAHRWYDAVNGVVGPLLVLGLPFVGLNAAAHHLYRRDHKAVAVAFFLAAVGLLPLLLIILFHETGFLVVAPDTPGQLFFDGSISNRQLQVTSLVACLWCGALALRTRTAALSTVFAILVFFCGVSVLSDLGLRSWLEDGRWDLLALHALPLVAVYAGLGALAERQQRPWFAGRPMWQRALLVIVVLELLALDGRTFHYLGFSLQSLQSASVSDPAAPRHAGGDDAERRRLLRARVRARSPRHRAPDDRGPAALHALAVRHPAAARLSGANRRVLAALRLDLSGLALVIALLSQPRQRRGFYYAGVLNTGAALYLIADHRDWFDRPLWAIAVIVAGLIVLAAGFVFDRREKRHVSRAGTP